MGLALTRKIKSLIPGMVGNYPSDAKIYRERGGTPVLEESGAVRMRFDDLPDMHRIETGEETKAVDLEAIIQKYESEDPEDALYIVEGVPGPDGERRDLVLRDTVEHGQIQQMQTMGGSPTLHFYEAESGQLINWLPKFVDNEDLDGDIHEAVRNGDTDRYDLPEDLDVEDASDSRKVGIRPYLIDNKDERLTAWMDHLKRKFEKYEGGEGFWSEHFEVAMVLAVGLSITMIYYAVFGNIGELIPIAKDIAQTLPEVNANVESLAEGVTPSDPNSGGSPPGS